MRKKLLFFALTSSLSVLLVSATRSPVLAQSNIKGAIRGTVHEEKNPSAGIPNATVTILNLQTGYTTETITGNGGVYSFEFITPGNYKLSAEAKEYEQVANSVVPLFDVNFNMVSVVTPPPLELRKSGAAAIAAQPTPPPASTPQDAPGKVLVNLEEATRGANFDERVILALPFSGSRTFDQLAFLAAGVAPSPQAIGDTIGPGVGPGVGTSGQFAVNGLRSRANNFTVDGSDNNDEDIGVRRQGFTALVPQPVESLQGFYIATLLPRSQFGRNLGAQVNAISRGGGRQVHGALYGFFTDRHLKARDAFDMTGGTDDVLRRANGQPVLLDNNGNRRMIPLPNPVGGESPFTRGQYGLAVGGPLTKRNTFFFSSFERRDVNATKEANFAVPTVAERGLFGCGETGFRISRTPVTGPCAFRANIQGQAFSTSVVGDSYISLFPFPNNPRGPYAQNTYTEHLPASADGTIFSLKLDQPSRVFGKEHSLTGRYNFTDDATTLPVTGEALFSTLRALVRTQNLSLFLASVISPQFSNELRFSYGRTRLDFDEARDPFLRSSRLRGFPFLLNAGRLKNATLPEDTQTLYQTSVIDTETDTDPLGQVIVSGFSPIGTDVFNFPQRRVNNTFQIADTAIYNIGRQRLIGGADFRRTQLNSQLDRNFRPVAYFSGTIDVAPLLGRSQISPNGFFQGADFLAAGAATGFLQTQSLAPDSTIGLRLWQANLFASDQISVRPNFRLTLGLRYEANTVPEEVNGRIESSFTSSEVQRFIAEEKRLYGVSGFENSLGGRRSIFRRDLNNIAPHIAFAWDPFGDGKTAVRAGYGIYFDQVPGAVISQSRSVFPRFLTVNLAGVQDTSEIIAFNPARLTQEGALNVYDPNNGSLSGRNLVELLLNLNRFATPQPDSFPAGPGFVLPNANLVTPYAQHWGLTVEREAYRSLLLSIAYTGTRGVHLLRQATPNLGLNAIPVVNSLGFFGNILFNGFALSPGAGFRRPFPLLGSFTSIESDANSIYHSLQAEASMRLTRGVQFTAAYTWSRAIDEVSDLFELAGARGLPQNSFDRGAERADANFDLRHRFVSSFIYDLPIFTRSKFLGGWQLAGIVTLQTGQPFTVISSIDVNLDGNLSDRLNTLAGVREVVNGSLRYEFPATSVEQFRMLSAAGADGAVGRNTFRAPGIINADLAVNKVFRFTERHQLEFRTEIFNLFNLTHFGIPAHTLFAP
ncbi:MAG TPA: carboxypeptidase-like regulatory domain-containing protein, partial [Blastocatellia bacterium]|nr:carboxypeptidase-like regulatory domain-containing protein [Blastocatellia bacterium]